MVTSFEMGHFRYNKHLVSLLILLILAGIGTASWFGYQWYRKHAEGVAQLDLSLGIETFNRALTTPENNAEWQEVEHVFQIGAQRHASSLLYPYFLAYQADALIHQGKNTQALTIMNKIFDKITNEQELYYPYAIKRALMKLDMPEQEIQQIGKKELQELANDANNILKDMTYYYIGFYQAQEGKKDQAHQTWKQLITDNQDSVWALMAQEKLK